MVSLAAVRSSRTGHNSSAARRRADETVFELMVPTDEPQFLQDALRIFSQFATSIRCSDGDLAKERGAVLDVRLCFSLLPGQQLVKGFSSRGLQAMRCCRQRVELNASSNHTHVTSP